MDEVRVAFGGALLLSMALGWAAGWLAAELRRERQRRRVARGRSSRFRDNHERSVHLFLGQGEALTVAELLEEAVEQGEGIRLNWPEDDLESSPIRADERGQFPTVILPRAEGDGEVGQSC